MASQPSDCEREAAFEHAIGAGSGTTELAIRQKDNLLRALDDSRCRINLALEQFLSLLRDKCLSRNRFLILPSAAIETPAQYRAAPLRKPGPAP